MQDIMDNFIKIEGGSFVMGSDQPEYPDEAAHDVTVKSFWIQETPVTQKLWTEIMEYNPSIFTDSLFLPVSNISWLDCRNFIKRLNKKAKRKFRLPTEMEWEYAARGGNKSKGYKYSGSNNLDNIAWYLDNSNNIPHEVRTKIPNELSIYDMNGNVWEWCSSSIGSHILSIYRILRGGSFASQEDGCKLEIRSFDLIYRKSITYGFRLASDC